LRVFNLLGRGDRGFDDRGGVAGVRTLQSGATFNRRGQPRLEVDPIFETAIGRS